MNKEKQFQILRTLVAVSIALVLAFFIIFMVSDEPIKTLFTFIAGPLKSKRYVGNVIELAIPLIFSGLATSILFETGLFNLGSEGIFFISGITATAVVLFLKATPFFNPIIAILAGSLVGMIAASIPAVLKAKWNASELVTSLMFNSIFLGIGLYILNYHLRDSNLTEIASLKFPESARLSKIIPGTRIHAGLIIALVMVIIVYYFLYKTKWGYSLRMTGINPKFAQFSGINTFWVIIYVHLFAGFIAGMGGSVEVLGMYNRFRWSSLPGLGFDGALVAMLAKNKPFSVIGAAMFLAYIRIGADLMARLTDVPAEMVAIIQAVIILLISAEKFLEVWRHKMLLKEAR